MPDTTLLDIFLRGTVVLLLGWGVLLVTRRRSAALRELVGRWTLVALCALPLVALFAPGMPLLPAELVAPGATPDGEVATVAAVSDGSRPVPLASLEDIEHEFGATAFVHPPAGSGDVATSGLATDGAAFDVAAWLVVGWALGALLLVVHTLAGRLLAARRLRLRHASRLSDASMRELGVPRDVPVLLSAQAAQPLTIGVWRPRIVVPASFRRWDVVRQRAVLAHESAHVERRDAAAVLMWQLARALWWPHPLVWGLGRWIALAREQACDDRVLADGAAPTSYAATLVDVARGLRQPSSLSSRSQTPNGALAMVRTSQLEARVRALLSDEVRRAAPRWHVHAAAAAMTLVATLALGSAVAAAPQDPVREPPPAVEDPSEPLPIEVPSLPPGKYRVNPGTGQPSGQPSGLPSGQPGGGVPPGDGPGTGPGLPRDLRGMPGSPPNPLLPEGGAPGGGPGAGSFGSFPELPPTVLPGMQDPLRRRGDPTEQDPGERRGAPTRQLEITERGDVRAAGEPIELDDLVEWTRRIEPGSRKVVVRCSPDAASGLVVRVIDLLELGGAEDVQLATLPPRPVPLLMHLFADGRVAIRRRTFSIEEIASVLEEQGDRAKVVRLSVEPDTRFSLLSKVLDDLKRAGAEDVSLSSPRRPAEERFPAVDPGDDQAAQPPVEFEVKRWIVKLRRLEELNLQLAMGHPEKAAVTAAIHEARSTLRALDPESLERLPVDVIEVVDPATGRFPSAIVQVSPELTTAMRRAAPGRVAVHFVVDETGRVEEPRIESSSDPVFEQATLAAVRQWRYVRPVGKNGEPKRVEMHIEVVIPGDDPERRRTGTPETEPGTDPATVGGSRRRTSGR